MRALTACMLLSGLLLAGCDDAESLAPSWLAKPHEIKRTPGERIDVIFAPSSLTPDKEVEAIPVEIPEQANLSAWTNLNQAMATTPHPGLTGITQEQHHRVGAGHKFSRNNAPSPVIANGIVAAMDAAGVISAHDESDIDRVLWTNNDGLDDDTPDVLGGGLAIDNGTLYATTGKGSLRAINLADGKLKWSINVGAPVRGAPAVGEGLVLVLTADNQTIAVDAATGGARWTHRGIREVASYFSTTAPVVSDGIVISAYSSGELFALRAETGGVLWSDTLGSAIKTRASAVFSGIDADPIVQEGVVVAISASGEMQASALKNGRPLWQKRISAHSTPWSAGNAIFVLSDTHDVAAVFKRDGAIRWAKSLSQTDERDTNKDITPALYGPILAGNAILVLDATGVLTAIKPQDGTALSTYTLAKNTVTAPIITNGALYIITRDARLHRYH